MDPINSKLQNCAFLGNDDGYDSQKCVVLYKGKRATVRIPSFITIGGPARANLDGSEADLYGYTTFDSDGNECTFTVGDEQKNIIRTDTRDFMGSPAARVLLYHTMRLALAKVDYNGIDPVYCYTGLPVETYYIGSQRNNATIKAKLDHITPTKGKAGHVIPLDSTLGPMPNIKFVGCQPEAISAWFAYTISIDENLSLTPHLDRSEKKIIVVDVGGRTIDIIPMHRGSPSYPDKSSIHDKGTIYLIKLLEQEIKLNRGQDIPYLEGLEFAEYRNALITSELSIFGKQLDVSEQVESAIVKYRNEIAPLIFSKLESLRNYGYVMFVGGPIEMLIGDDHSRWAPRMMDRIHFDKDMDPAFMNAWGMAIQSVVIARNDISRDLAKKSA